MGQKDSEVNRRTVAASSKEKAVEETSVNNASGAKTVKPTKSRAGTRFTTYVVTAVITLSLTLNVFIIASKLITSTYFFKYDSMVERLTVDKWNTYKRDHVDPAMRKATSFVLGMFSLERQFTAEELDKYSGLDESLPVYISIHRQVFDVSAGREFYARGSGGYGMFGGRDATRAFITGEFTWDLTCDLSGIPENQIQESIDHWLTFYEEHSTYFKVGVLADGYECPPALMPKELAAAKAKAKQEREVAKTVSQTAQEVPASSEPGQNGKTTDDAPEPSDNL